ncbi:MAG: hypothetical protein GYB68_06845 [Chloroflexi bacterium]|nr:hypothetical protein [Chloroflexota bacterium]
MAVIGNTTQPLTMKRTFETWWPLAASWLLMGTELPMLSAFVARLADPEIHLAAYGGVVFPIALIIEAPIIMLLAASTAYSKEWDSYVKLRRFMMRTSAILTVIHILIAFTPLYDLIVIGLLRPPPEIIEPARIGLMIMTPWTWTIGYRRFQQGVLIRFGHSRAVGVGTGIRLASVATMLTIGFVLQWPGIVTATAAIASGVTSEAIYAGFRVRPVLRDELKLAPPPETALTFQKFIAFYIPLSLTSLLLLLIQPLGSAALSRMPDAISSLAIWPVIFGFTFMFRSFGVAYNEVVVALLDEPQAADQLRRFSTILIVGITAAIALVALTPISRFWFGTITGLAPELTDLAVIAFMFSIPMPALQVVQSWYQGAIVFSKKTRAVTESVVLFLLVCGAILWAGVMTQAFVGIYVGLTAFGVAMLVQNVWLWLRSRTTLAEVRQRDQRDLPLDAAQVPAK